MTSIQQALSMTRGDTREWNFAVTDASNIAVSLASHNGIRFTGKLSLADLDASAIFQKSLASGATTGGGFTISSLSGGTGTVKLSPTDTATLDEAIRQLSYDIQFTDADGNKYTVAQGVLTVRPDVTLS